MIRRTLSAGLCLTLLVTASAAGGVGPIDKTRPWIGVHGAWSTYAMKNVNDAIEQINRDLSGANGYDPLGKSSNGLGFGAMAGLDFRRGLSLNLG